MKRLFLLVPALFIMTHLLAQNPPPNTNYDPQKDKKAAKRERINNLMKMEEEGDLIFNKHSIFGIKLSTDGYGISYEKGKYKTNSKTSILQFELNEKKSPKYHKVTAAGFNGYDFNSVVIGKLNNFYQLKASIGQQYLIGGKGNKNGVAVTALYMGGVSLGILKPYYVNVVGNSSDFQFRSKYPTIIDSNYEVLGASGFTVGWGEVSIRPGLNAKTALRFDYGRYNESVAAIEVGLSGEYYFSKIPMLYLVPEKNFFFNAYVTILFGRRK